MRSRVVYRGKYKVEVSEIFDFDPCSMTFQWCCRSKEELRGVRIAFIKINLVAERMFDERVRYSRFLCNAVVCKFFVPSYGVLPVVTLYNLLPRWRFNFNLFVA